MKKILIILVLAIAILTLSGCNYQFIDLNYNFKKVHTTFDGETYKCYEIESWKDYDGEQIQVNIKDYGTVLLSSFNTILIEDKCPYCDKR